MKSKKLHRVRRLTVRSPRNSLCGSAYMKDLDFSYWFTDGNYLHVKHRDGTIHAVECRESEIPRLAFRDGELYWLIDA